MDADIKVSDIEKLTGLDVMALPGPELLKIVAEHLEVDLQGLSVTPYPSVQGVMLKVEFKF